MRKERVPMTVNDETTVFDFNDQMPKDIHETLQIVYGALEEKGYQPINQIVGYLLSGDPAYIPRLNDARNLIKRHERDEIIEEPRAQEARDYAKMVEDNFGLSTDFQDERLTTVQAERMLIEEADVSRKKRKKVIDKIAAEFILQNYLDRNGKLTK